MISMKLRFNSSDIRSKLSKEKLEIIERIPFTVIEALKSATPVDTGLASNSWSFTKNNLGFTVSNTQDYVKYLNAGTSAQAPARFIEITAAQFGRLSGEVVKYE